MLVEDLRVLLDKLTSQEIDLGKLCADAPGCACEGASSPAGCFGPVQDVEKLCYFLCSPSEMAWPRDEKALQKKIASRGIRPASFKRAFKSGLSVIRLDKASEDEISLAARIQYENMCRKDIYSGGIYAVFQFSAKDARTALGEFGLCVYETPLDQVESGAYLRPSHADVAIGKIPKDDIEQSALERRLYDYLMDSITAECIPAENIKVLHEYLPQALSGLKPK